MFCFVANTITQKLLFNPNVKMNDSIFEKKSSTFRKLPDLPESPRGPNPLQIIRNGNAIPGNKV